MLLNENLKGFDLFSQEGWNVPMFDLTLIRMSVPLSETFLKNPSVLLPTS